jgi:hypothetical protein
VTSLQVHIAEQNWNNTPWNAQHSRPLQLKVRSQTQNPKPKTQNPKLQTQNPKPHTLPKVAADGKLTLVDDAYVAVRCLLFDV